MKQYFSLQPPQYAVSKVSVLEVVRNKNHTYSYRNGRRKHGFVYVQQGSLRNVFYREASYLLTLQAGELLFIPQGCAYDGEYTEDNTQTRIVEFDIPTGSLPDYLSRPVKLELPEVKALVDAFFVMGAATTHPFYLLSCLYTLLWQIDESQTWQSSHFAKLRPAIYSLQTDTGQNYKVDYYAALCNMGEGNFRRLFRQCTGKSPIEYRNEIRLRNARRLLRSGAYNVSEAAEATGFTNHSFFIRLYKKKYGHTPKRDS